MKKISIYLLVIVMCSIIFYKPVYASNYSEIKEKTSQKSSEEFDQYYDALSSNNTDDIETSDSDIAGVIWTSFFVLHTELAKLFPLLVIASVITGIVIMMFSKKNKVLYKKGLVYFIITIPIILIIVTFIIPQLYVWFA